MKKSHITLILILIAWIPLFSQNSSDALRFSRIQYGGTARFQGMGGAFGALGADFSVLATNPAGIGLFKSSELSVSPSGWISHNTSDFNGVSSSENTGNFAMGNLGVIFSIKPQKSSKSSGFRNFNFGFGLNRQNDFNSELNMMGPNRTSSMMTDWVNILNDQYLSPDQVDENYQFDIGLAHMADLIFLSDSASRYYANDAQNGGVYQQKHVSTWGSINEMNFSWGANYNDLLYFGITIGVPFIRYYEVNQYWEDKLDSVPIPYFRSLNYNQTIETHGTGINLKAGLIFRPANWVRLGASIHTPTYYGNMRDQYSSSIYAKFDSLDVYPYNDPVFNERFSPLGDYNYNLTTPFRFMGSVAFIIGQYGLISAEYEYANYNQARLGSDYYSNEFLDVNDEIQVKYRSPFMIRCGTEWRVQDFRIRGGFGYSGSPYENAVDNVGQRYTASGGIGYRGKLFFSDLAYVWSQMKQEYYFYDSNLVNHAYNTLTSHSIVATVGIRF
jgi:hypothetical protein